MAEEYTKRSYFIRRKEALPMEKVIEGSKAAMSRAIFTREWFANYLSGLDSIKKGALKRMRGYRNPKVEKNNMDEFFSSLKNHLPKMKQ